jgi:hypothetical protein
MARSQLRLYQGPETASRETFVAKTGQRNVTVPVGEVLPLLADAILSQRTWLDDFTDDEMIISSDLYEVLLAYRHFRRPSA